MKKLLHDAAILLVITVISGALLGAAHAITAEPIAAAREQKTQDAYRKVFAEAAEFAEAEGFDADEATAQVAAAGYADDAIDAVAIARDASGEALGCVVTVTSSAGYGGDITLSVGVTNEGVCNGYSITSISETAGLGMNATGEAFSSQFVGVSGTLAVSKSGGGGEGVIDAISGATITSRAVTNAVNAALLVAAQVNA